MDLWHCGTTVGSELAAKLQWPFADADDFHSEANKKKMAEGCPLNDQDRLPWLISIHEQIDRWSLEGQNGVLTCSALKQVYRQILLTGLPSVLNADNECGAEEKQLPRNIEPNDVSQPLVFRVCSHGVQNLVVFVFLRVPEEVLVERLTRRTGHFMPSSLLQSQLDALEEPSLPEHYIIAEADKCLSEILEDCLIKVESCFKAEKL